MILRVLVVAVFITALQAHPLQQSKQSAYCLNNPCHNGGTCVRTPDSYTCSCDIKFYGKLCQNSCPCLNGGRCLESEGESAPSCLCAPKTHGDFCQFTWTEDAINEAVAHGEHPQTVPFHVKQAWTQNPHLMRQIVSNQQKLLDAWEHGRNVHPMANSKKEYEEDDEEDELGPDETEDDELKQEMEDEEGERKEEMDDEMQAAKELKTKKKW